jgi:hypothetical protein
MAIVDSVKSLANLGFRYMDESLWTSLKSLPRTLTTVQQNVDSALEGIVGLDTTYHTLFNLMSGNELERQTSRAITPVRLCIENIVLVHDTIDPFVKIHVTDLRLANIIIKNTIGANAETFMRLRSNITDALGPSSSTITSLPVSTTMSIEQTPNQALFPPVYQYRFCIKAIDTLVSENLPWLRDAYRTTIPRSYQKPTLWTLVGGAFEISGYAPTAYGKNERRSTMSEVSNHLSNYKGVTLTMRKSEVGEVSRLIQAWCQKEDDLRPSVCQTWRENSWKPLLGYNQNALCRKVIESTKLYRMLEQAAQKMIRSNVQSCMCCLLYGPPGTGKTRTVFELARRLGYNLFVSPIVHDDSDVHNSAREIASFSTQLASLANATEPFVLLIDDIMFENGKFADCTLSRPKMLSLFEGQAFPRKSIIIMVSNNMNHVDISQMYDGAMCRNGRVRLIESKGLDEAEKKRIRRLLRTTIYRRVNLGPITLLCDLFAKMITAESSDDEDSDGDVTS